MIDSAGFTAPEPDVSDLQELIIVIKEMDYCESNATGLMPLSWHSIRDWLELMQISLAPSDVSCIRSMSSAFISGIKSDNAPYEPLASQVMLASSIIMTSSTHG